jgi:hypothetical protein
MRFKTTQNILKDSNEVFDSSWDSIKEIWLPPTYDWDYSRELQIEDVDIWEVIYEQSGGVGVYAAWCPYAEFYIIRVGWKLELKGYGIETYYGPGSMKKVQKRMTELKIPFGLNKIWVDSDQMHLYS